MLEEKVKIEFVGLLSCPKCYYRGNATLAAFGPTEMYYFRYTCPKCTYPDTEIEIKLNQVKDELDNETPS